MKVFARQHSVGTHHTYRQRTKESPYVTDEPFSFQSPPDTVE